MRQLLKSKKGAEMTIGTIIIIILALVVLVFLIYSFMKGGGSLLDTLKNFISGPNVDTIKSSCLSVCTTQSTFAFCKEVRTLKISDKESYLGSCKSFATASKGGVADCPAINCASETPLNTCTVLEGTWSLDACRDNKNKDGKTNDITSQVEDTTDKGTNKYCCALPAAVPATPAVPANP